jgi:hypothetical protein
VDVIELQDNGIRFAAVDTWMRPQILEKLRAILQPLGGVLSPDPRDVDLSVSCVVLAEILSRADSAPLVPGTKLAAAIVELGEWEFSRALGADLHHARHYPPKGVTPSFRRRHAAP